MRSFQLFLAFNPILAGAVGPDEIRVAYAGIRKVQNLRLIVALLDGAGNFVAGKEGNLEFALKDSSLAELSNHGLNATLTLAAPAGADRARMVVEEQGGKLTASSAQVRIP